MNKTEFIKAVAEKGGINAKEASNYFDAVIGVISEAIKNGDKIIIPGFGTYELKNKPSREGINPMTKEKITIKESNVPAFKFFKSFKEKFN